MMLGGCGETADTLVLGASAERRTGSSPVIRTIDDSEMPLESILSFLNPLT